MSPLRNSAGFPSRPKDRDLYDRDGSNIFLNSIIDDEKYNCLEPVEKKIDLSIKEKMELRGDLIDRTENIVSAIIESLFDGKLPKVRYTMTNIDTLMEQIESVESHASEAHESYERSSTVTEDSFDFLQNPDSGFSESLEQEPIDTSNDLKKSFVTFKSGRSKNTFASIITAMAKLHQLLVVNKTETRRGFFYELQSDDTKRKLISSQTQINKIVNIVGNILQCPPCEMALVASAKGLCSGDLTLTFDNSEKIDYSTHGGVLISPNITNAISLRTRAFFVLIVEKDAVFHKLLQENCPQALNCILITGKGYPDVATRNLVKILAEKLHLPVYIFVDADPYGIEIMFTYKYGSINFSYDGANLACPAARWIGLRPSDVERLDIPTIPLADHDTAKLDVIQTRPYVTDFVSKELQIIRRHGKAEIEALIVALGPGQLCSSYIRTHLLDARYI